MDGGATADEGAGSGPSAGPGAPARRPPRDGYIDTLRAAALIRVVAYHVYGWIWLPFAFPSMGVMFALAGSLMATSLDRSKHRPLGVLRKRLRRLLPPLWLMGLLLVPLMIWHGWTSRADGATLLNWRTMLLWILPISDPPGSDWGIDWVVPLWYIRAYLWFVLLSPSFLWLFRRWPKRVMSIPILVMLLVATGGIDIGGRTGDAVLSMATFGACWLLGFAHHDGTLRALPWRVVLPLGVTLLAAGIMWAVTHPDPESSWNVDDIPAALTLYSLGAVVLLLRANPTARWAAPGHVFGGLVSAINARAVTIYLWNNVAVFAALLLIDSWGVTAGWDTDTVLGQTLLLAGTWICLLLAIAAFGWAEDLAAGRPMRINPWPGRQRTTTRSVMDRLPDLNAGPPPTTREAPSTITPTQTTGTGGADRSAATVAGSSTRGVRVARVPPAGQRLLSGLLVEACPDTTSCTPRAGTVAP
ncbi:MAG TPA: acyltransferase [Kineosporiaceae bacterium]|nr:acyltransferase [Kineosporiaceae bacterium]